MSAFLVILGIVVGGYCLISRRFPLLPVAAALVVAGIWNGNMSVVEGWVFALILLVGLGLTWPKNWGTVSTVRQWIVGAAVLLLTIGMVVSPGSLFDNGYGWAILLCFAAVVLFVLALKIGWILLIGMVLVLIATFAWQSIWAPTSSMTPSPSVTTSSSVTPSPSSSQPVTNLPLGAFVTDVVATNWKQLDSRADAAFKKVVGMSKPDQGNLSKAKTWTSPADDARLVVVFASKAEISDKKALELVGANALVTRATGCYTPYDAAKVCPSGDQRVVLTLAPTLVDNRGLGLVDDWGIAVFKTEDGKFAYWPITYQ